MGISFVILSNYGLIRLPFAKFLSVLNPFQRVEMPLVESVQEHRPATWGAFYYQFGALVFLAPLGFIFALRKPTDKNILVMIYSLTALYFSASMIRLTIILAPALCILGAYALVNIIDQFIEIMKGASSRRRRRFMPRVGKGYSLIIIATLFTTIIYPLTRSIDYGYSPTTIDSSSIPIRTNIGDWSETLTWLQNNLPPDTVVASWWDYGYWITVIGDKISLADNGTINGTQIARLGQMFMSNETEALTILKHYDAEYVVVFTTLRLALAQNQPILYGDEVKWRWMARIGGLDDAKLADTSITQQIAYIGYEGGQDLSWLGNLELPKNDTVLTKLMIYGAIPEYDSILQLKPNNFDLAFSSKDRMVLVYRVVY
jgi:dolichyl-diphosphooligosaccharide--protein glycosyltransferase